MQPSNSTARNTPPPTLPLKKVEEPVLLKRLLLYIYFMGNLHDNPKMKDKRRQLRQNLTPAEASLWKMLKGKQLMSRKFRRQHSIGHYIVDFYCAEERLIIELDGEVHKYQSDYDFERTQYLESLNYKVIRFENRLVLETPEAVLNAITDAFTKE